MLCVGCLKWSPSAPVCEFCTSSGTCPKEAPYPMDYGLSCCPSRLRGPKCEGKKEGSLLHITDTKECCPKEPSECPGESSCGPAQDPSRELAKQWHRRACLSHFPPLQVSAQTLTRTLSTMRPPAAPLMWGRRGAQRGTQAHPWSQQILPSAAMASRPAGGPLALGGIMPQVGWRCPPPATRNSPFWGKRCYALRWMSQVVPKCACLWILHFLRNLPQGGAVPHELWPFLLPL